MSEDFVSAPVSAPANSIDSYDEAVKSVAQVRLAPIAPKLVRAGKPRRPPARKAMTPEQQAAAKATRAEVKRTRLAHFEDILAAIMRDLGFGPIPEARRQLARRYAALCCIAEDHERRLLSQARFDPKKYAELCTSMVRMASKLGLAPTKGQAADVPALGDYLRDKAEDDQGDTP
jgi:hypothetical protein